MDRSLGVSYLGAVILTGQFTQKQGTQSEAHLEILSHLHLLSSRRALTKAMGNTSCGDSGPECRSDGGCGHGERRRDQPSSKTGVKERTKNRGQSLSEGQAPLPPFSSLFKAVCLAI